MCIGARGRCVNAYGEERETRRMQGEAEASELEGPGIA